MLNYISSSLLLYIKDFDQITTTPITCVITSLHISSSRKYNLGHLTLANIFLLFYQPVLRLTQNVTSYVCLVACLHHNSLFTLNLGTCATYNYTYIDLISHMSLTRTI